MFDKLIMLSIKKYVEENKENYSECPTPDCQ